MSIIKIKKSANYTVIDNAPIKDPNLSWQHKGLLTFLMSLPDDWQIYKTELHKHAKNGRDSTIKVFNELIKFGYINQIPTNDSKFGFDYIVSDVPFLKISNGESVTENQELISKEEESKINKLYKSKKAAEIEEVILDDTNEEKENKKSFAKKIKELLEPENGNYYQFQIAFQELRQSKKITTDANGFPPHWTDELKLAFVDWCNIICLKKTNRWGYRPQIIDEFDTIDEYLIKWTAEQITDCLKYAKSKSNSNYFPEWTLKNIEKQNKTKTKKKSTKPAQNYDAVRQQLSDPNFLKS